MLKTYDLVVSWMKFWILLVLPLTLDLVTQRVDYTNVFFSLREFAVAFQYHVHEGLCHSEAPSSAPSFSLDTDAPSISSAPSESIKHSYAKHAVEDGLCPDEDFLETMFDDGTGSLGGCLMCWRRLMWS